MTLARGIAFLAILAVWALVPSMAWSQTDGGIAPGPQEIKATPDTSTKAAVIPGNSFPRVSVGPGLVDASVRQVVRTISDRVYIFAADDTAERQGSGPGVIRAWRADQAGNPTSFSEADGGNRPSAVTTSRVLSSPDVRLDVNGIVHLLFTNEANGSLVYKTFSTLTDTWGAAQIIDTGVKVPTFFVKRGETTSAIILDQNEVPHVVYIAGNSLLYRNRVGGTWSASVPLASGGDLLHPQLAFDAAGEIHATWLDDSSPQTIHYQQRASDGTWGATEVVASNDVLENSSLDQGPSIVVTQSGTPYVLYVSASSSAVRVKFKSGSSWVFDNPPNDIVTHTPQIYARGDDIYVFLGHDINSHYGYLVHVAGEPWSDEIELSVQDADGSASIRWDPQRENNPGIIDTSYFDEDIFGDSSFIAELFYVALEPSTSSNGGDTTPPTVSVTSPADGATVSGSSVAVSATASDDVGVVGVQFRLDGTNLGAEDTIAPYTIQWDTTTVANGSHLLTAVARDAADNQTISSAINVNVSNVAPAPTLGALQPTSTEAGPSSFSLTVSGSNFVSGSVVRWNGSDRPTTFVSGTELTASLSAGDLASGGTAEVLVFNPSPGGGVSGSLTFAVTDFGIGISPANVTVTQGQTATYSLTLTPQFGTFGNSITLSCANLPALTSCAFSPGSSTPGDNPATVTVTVSTSATSALLAPPFDLPEGAPLSALYFGLSALALLAVWLVRTLSMRRRHRLYMPAALLIACLWLLAGCSSTTSTTPPPNGSPGTPIGAHTITIDGTSGSLVRSITATLTVQ